MHGCANSVSDAANIHLSNWPETKYSSDLIEGILDYLLHELKIMMCTVSTLPALSPVTTKDRLIELKSSRGREKQVLE